MSLNLSSSSSSSNVSLITADLSSSNASTHSVLYICFDSRPVHSISTAFIVAKTFFLLPLFIVVLCLGQQRCRRQHANVTASNADLFTYHMAAMELISTLGWGLFCAGAYTDLQMVMLVGFFLSSTTFPGQTLFHILTCLERYLAVVHPITYLSLRKAGRVRVIHVSIACVWLLCVGWVGLMASYRPEFPKIPLVCLLAFSVIVISFCSLSVLYALIRSGPGELGRHRERVDQSKQRAFNTIMLIMGVLLLWCAGLMICSFFEASHTLSEKQRCVILISGIWSTLPGKLVLPLLFLNRAGKLPCCHSRA